MTQPIENKEIRGVNLRTLLVIVSGVVSIMVGVNRITSKIDEFGASQRQMQAVYDLQIKTLQTQIDEIHNDVILNRKIIQTK